MDFNRPVWEPFITLPMWRQEYDTKEGDTTYQEYFLPHYYLLSTLLPWPWSKQWGGHQLKSLSQSWWLVSLQWRMLMVTTLTKRPHLASVILRHTCLQVWCSRKSQLHLSGILDLSFKCPAMTCVTNASFVLQRGKCISYSSKSYKKIVLAPF